MRSVGDGELLDVWERGVDRSTPERALAMLAAAEPATPWRELGALPVAERDRRLLALRRARFGDRLEARLTCAACGGAGGFETTVTELLDATAGAPADVQVTVDGATLCVRAPSALDLVLAARCGDADAAGALVLERCVTCEGASPAPWRADALPDAARAAVLDAVERTAGPAALQVATACAACGARAVVEFDIAAFLWQEVAAEARRLAAEVAALARAFGWRERDVLALSPARRRLYLELATP